ncbi:MAG: O-methyltransferase [Vicinamibacterales bacterium]
MTDVSVLERVDRYIEDLFTPQDPALIQNIDDANAAGLPPINVSPNQGKLLYLLARIAGARRILEIGTLGGYSTTWLARALPPDGVVVSLELDPKHADVARRSIARAAPDRQVEIRVGRAADTLKAMIAKREPSFDFIFIDADKPGYSEYLELALQLSRSNTVIVADNLIRNGLVLETSPPDENATAARAFNAAIAANDRLESIILPIMRKTIDGLSISIVR